MMNLFDAVAMDAKMFTENTTDTIGYDEQLSNLASNLALTKTQRPQTADMRLVLIAHGATHEQAEHLSSPEVKVLPFINRRCLAPEPLCKSCGLFHQALDGKFEKRCPSRAQTRWSNSLQATGWEGAFGALRMRGYKIYLRQDLEYVEPDISNLTQYFKEKLKKMSNDERRKKQIVNDLEFQHYKRTFTGKPGVLGPATATPTKTKSKSGMDSLTSMMAHQHLDITEFQQRRKEARRQKLIRRREARLAAKATKASSSTEATEPAMAVEKPSLSTQMTLSSYVSILPESLG